MMWPSPFDDYGFHERARPAINPDVRLTGQVIERIRHDPQLEGERITVEVQNRVVSLSGTVSSLHARVTAAALARSAPGVADICNRLKLARSADVTTAMETLPRSSFDELIANWNNDGPQATRQVRPPRDSLLGVAAASVAVVTGVLCLVLMPRFAGVGLILALPCVVLAAVLALRAGRGRTSTSDPTSPGQAHSS